MNKNNTINILNNIDHIYWMQHALEYAMQAFNCNEVPIGAIIIDLDSNKIIGTGHNCVIKNNDPTAHAEIIALRNAANTINNYRLINTALYTTVEPCIMCVGAMIHARIKHIIFGTIEPKFGAIISNLEILSYPWNHQIEYIDGVLAEESSNLLQQFFKSKR